MTLPVWFIICFVLCAISWSLLFFRRRLATLVAKNPQTIKVLGFALLAFLVALSLTPIVILVCYSMG